MTTTAVRPPSCAGCAHFERQPLALERMIAGLRTMSSGFASVLGDDGVCRHHDRMVAARAHCDEFSSARHFSETLFGG
jgi:hypothetical protein